MAIIRKADPITASRLFIKPATYAFIFIIIALDGWGVKAQSITRLSAYMDAGENNVSQGFYMKTAVLGSYQKGKYVLNAGGQLDIINSGDKIFTGSKFMGGRVFSIKNFDFQIHGLFMYNSISENVFETNWGVLSKVERKHFHYQLGTNFRAYHLPRQVRKEYNPDVENKIKENWNLIYLIAYNLKPDDYIWNVGITVTNIDHFILSQETNPMINLHGRYRISDPIMLYAESWYKSAGALNISVNYFGFFFRLGLIWKIDLEKK